MFQPPGFHSVTPYFFVDNAAGFVAFLVAGLGGELLGTTLRADGLIANARVRLGDSAVMVSEASADFPAMAAPFYLYVADADAAMARAMAAGAVQIMPVSDMPYDDRQGGVRDAWGQIWWLSQRLVAGPYQD
jgi:PhnB protein